nr:unnamed protein product [Callosobruchus analis]
MSESRANLEPQEKPWYVGWSNCNDNAGKVLQQYYSKPYFLGNNSEDIALTWIFMGGPGYGAQMHVDNVHYPSWQAQLKGKKLWRLVPPPECYLSCHKMEVVVQPGEISKHCVIFVRKFIQYIQHIYYRYYIISSALSMNIAVR